ncbi:uncharacterized protein CLUP02_03781 [Colletotrichum lupini]|uniref:Uncharacterized protein n=1 Tax=Colletotrichum lupini TaxID=145971 RepID=A0A9Q8SJ25_9PEZI|nr:uncharacterized protein CLUP02_03781 [Colletotrichum lupini]UQC78304.1 hypothetical protein CLUP02_03781 [Colletotrichum lupini]
MKEKNKREIAFRPKSHAKPVPSSLNSVRHPSKASARTAGVPKVYKIQVCIGHCPESLHVVSVQGMFKNSALPRASKACPLQGPKWTAWPGPFLYEVAAVAPRPVGLSPSTLSPVRSTSSPHVGSVSGIRGQVRSRSFAQARLVFLGTKSPFWGCISTAQGKKKKRKCAIVKNAYALICQPRFAQQEIPGSPKVMDKSDWRHSNTKHLWHLFNPSQGPLKLKPVPIWLAGIPRHAPTHREIRSTGRIPDVPHLSTDAAKVPCHPVTANTLFASASPRLAVLPHLENPREVPVTLRTTLTVLSAKSHETLSLPFRLSICANQPSPTPTHLSVTPRPRRLPRLNFESPPLELDDERPRSITNAHLLSLYLFSITTPRLPRVPRVPDFHVSLLTRFDLPLQISLYLARREPRKLPFTGHDTLYSDRTCLGAHL